MIEVNFKIYHAVERHKIKDDAENERRVAVHASWERMYEKDSVIPCHYWKYTRSAKSIGEKRDLPYLKDTLKFAMDKCNPEDVVMLTNDDIVCHPWLVHEVARHCGLYHAGSAHRVEIRESIPDLSFPPHRMMELGHPHFGRDLFAFTKEWLVRYWRAIPDFILGACEWDLCLSLLIRKIRGIETKNIQGLYSCELGCELPDGLILHKCHEATWVQKDIQYTSAANNHNRELCKNWIKTYCPSFERASITHHEFPMEIRFRHKAYRREFA